MKRLAMALVIGVLCAVGPMTRAFAGEGDEDRERIVKFLREVLSKSDGDRGKLIAEVERLVREVLAEREGRDDDDDDECAEGRHREGDHDEAEERRRGHDDDDDDDDDERESAGRGGFLGIQAEKGEHCVCVVRVLPGTAAAKAGLKEGDEVTTVNGKKVDDVPGLVRLISALDPGSKVRLGVLRGEKASTVKATLGQRPADDDEDEDDDD